MGWRCLDRSTYDPFLWLDVLWSVCLIHSQQPKESFLPKPTPEPTHETLLKQTRVTLLLVQGSSDYYEKTLLVEKKTTRPLISF